jgi:hypothetical protein
MFSRSSASANTLAELKLYEEWGIDALFGDKPDVPVVTSKVRRSPGSYQWTDLSFPSAHVAVSAPFRALSASSYQANDTVHARWIRHTDGRSRPTMIFLHSWMQPMSIFEDVMLLPRFARRLDVDVMSVHLPYHGRRKPKNAAFHGEYFWTADLVRTFEAMRQSVLDVRALVGWLEERGTASIGVMGVSLGGMVALALACFEERLNFCIPVAAHLDLAGVLADAGLLLPMREELQRHGWRPEDVSAYTRSLGLDTVVPTIDRDRILYVVGTHDRILAAHRCEALWRRWGEPPIHRFAGGHLGILTHMGSTLGVARSFLDDIRAREHAAPR